MTLDPRDPVAFGATLRARRRALGLTLVQVGDRSGLSHPFLSQVERGLARLSLPSLERLCRALGTSEVELFAQADTPRLVRRSDGVTGGYGHSRARVLAPGGTAFVPLEVSGRNAEPGGYHCHEEDEFVHVLTGEVDVDLAGDGVHRLTEGDSLYLDGGTAHRWFNPQGRAYRLLVVKERVRREFLQ